MKIVTPNCNLSRLISITIAVVFLSLAIWAIMARSRAITSRATPRAESDLQKGNERRSSKTSSESRDSIQGESRSRSRPRRNSQGVTVERTTALLRNSIAERVDLPEQTVGERIAAFQRILLETGLDATEIQVEFDDQDPIFNTNVGVLRMRNIPLDLVLRYLFDSAKVDLQVLPGALEFIAPKQKAEQAGAGQPATRSQSKSEGGDKPQPDAEGRSR